jgi:hypothetical protein
MLKINLEKRDEELEIIAGKIFGVDAEIDIIDDMDSVAPIVDKSDLLIYIYSVDYNNNSIGSVTLKQVHKQYDFDSEALFGFYESVAVADRATDEQFENISAIFNKKHK